MGIFNWFKKASVATTGFDMESELPTAAAEPTITEGKVKTNVKKKSPSSSTTTKRPRVKGVEIGSTPEDSPPAPKKPRATKKTAATKKKTQPKKKIVDFDFEVLNKSEKDTATSRGEPWVGVLGVELDLDDLGSGSFDLDWNDIFIAKLVRAGYRGKDDVQIVDQWFRTVCQNVLSEGYEQDQADPTNRDTSNRKDLGKGRTEFS